jgi:hypothetical protein
VLGRQAERHVNLPSDVFANCSVTRMHPSTTSSHAIPSGANLYILQTTYKPARPLIGPHLLLTFLKPACKLTTPSGYNHMACRPTATPPSGILPFCWHLHNERARSKAYNYEILVSLVSAWSVIHHRMVRPPNYTPKPFIFHVGYCSSAP